MTNEVIYRINVFISGMDLLSFAAETQHKQVTDKLNYLPVPIRKRVKLFNLRFMYRIHSFNLIENNLYFQRYLWLIVLKFKEFNLFCGHIRPVAQLVEHLTLNQGVEGSIPSEPTKIWITDLLKSVISRLIFCEQF